MRFLHRFSEVSVCFYILILQIFKFQYIFNPRDSVLILFCFIFSVYNKEKVEVKNNMGSKGRALKRRQAGGRRLFQKRRKRFKSSNNDIQSTEVVPQIAPNKAVSSSSKKLNPKETLLTPSNSNEVSHHNETAHE